MGKIISFCFNFFNKTKLKGLCNRGWLKVKNLKIKPFLNTLFKNNKYRFVIGLGIFALFIIYGIFIKQGFQFALSATFGWVQNSWSGGADTVNFSTHADRSNWNKYYSKDSGLEIVGNSVKTTFNNFNWNQTSAADFSSGTKSNTFVSSTGNLLFLLKLANAPCSNNFECASNNCSGGVCVVPCDSSTICGSSCVYQGESYPTIVVSNQCWFKKNLNVGTPLANASTLPTLGNGAVEKWCYSSPSSCTGDIACTPLSDQTSCENEGCSWSPASSYCATEGGLYTWAEANQLGSGCDTSICTVPNNNKGICPSGWHIPTDEEIKILEMFVNTSNSMTRSQADLTGDRGSNEGTLLKSGGGSGFDMLLSGLRSTSNIYGNRLSYGYLISADQYSSTAAFYRNLRSTITTVHRNTGYKATGYSVRCLKNMAATGQSCSFNYDCTGGSCVNSVCKVLTGRPCSVTADCSSANDTCSSGICKANNSGTCSADEHCLSGACKPGNACTAPQVAGSSCNSNADCSTGNCNGSICLQINGGACTADNQCISGACGVANTCINKQGANGQCNTNPDCETGHTCLNGLCKILEGQICTTNSQCASNNCANTGYCDCMGSFSGTDYDYCISDEYCVWVAGYTCQLIANGGACTSDEMCSSGACGANNTCITPQTLNGSCNSNPDCISGHECNGTECKISSGGPCTNGSDCYYDVCIHGWCE